MRMNNLEGISAEKWINETPEEDMANIFLSMEKKSNQEKLQNLFQFIGLSKELNRHYN